LSVFDTEDTEEADNRRPDPSDTEEADELLITADKSKRSGNLSASNTGIMI
jgi:hypothetical protein